jgi:hypothetical protein
MNLLFYATTFGADLWSFARYVSDRGDSNIKVLMPDPQTYLQEGVSQLFPLDAEIEKRRWYHAFGMTGDFNPDVTIMDNHIPLRAPSPYGLTLWHGFGWKGPNDEKEFRWLHFSITQSWGSAKQPNDHFRWQCFGPFDQKHRTEVSGMHPANCRQLGSASHDYLRKPIDRNLAQPYYPFDVVNQPTVLIAPTWHYGEVLEHWGSDTDLFPKLLQRCKQLGANVILRLHDSFRFDDDYVDFLKGLDERFDHVMLKFKNHHPDNFLDLQVSDVLITNYSSIANLFYATKRPTIHIYPVRAADEEFLWRNKTFAGISTKKVDSARYIWKLPPEEHGGLMARDFDQLMAHLKISIEDPTCCEQQATAFLDKHMLGADGQNCKRVWDAIQEMRVQ